MGDDALLIEVFDDPVESLEELQIKGAEVGVGIVAAVGEYRGLPVVVFGRQRGVTRPVHVVGKYVHHDLIEAVVANVTDELLRLGDAIAVFGVDGKEPIDFKGDGEVGAAVGVGKFGRVGFTDVDRTALAGLSRGDGE